MNQEYLSATQAAEYLGVSRARINQLASAGKIRRDEVGGYYVYTRAELDRWRAMPKDVGGRPKVEAIGLQINRGPEYVTG